MGRVFKRPPEVIRGKRVVYKNWYAEWQGADGKTHRRMIGPKKDQAVQALARFEEAERCRRLGLPDTSAQAEGWSASVAGLIPQYLDVLAGRDTSPEYRALVADYLARLAAGCRWHTLGAVTADSLTVYLGRRRDDPEIGNGPATLNSYLRVAKGFANWAARRYGLASPLEGLKPYPEAVDLRRSRRILTDGELAKLVEAARSCPAKGRAHFRGPERAVLYLVAAYTGLRAGELAELTPADFDLGGDPPVVTVRARDAKNKEAEPVPLPAHLVDTLRPFLAGRGRGEKLWPGNWAANRKQRDYLARDLARAKVAEFDREGERVTFHSLKRRYVVRLIDAGAKIHEVRRLARHKDVKTTLNYYAPTDLGALGKLADRLPRAG